jgi:Uma2 family endonuclease
MYHAGAIGTAVMTVHVVQGGDGLARRAFSADDVRRMVESGIMQEDEPFELVEGELIFMNAQGFAHDLIKSALGHKLGRFLPERFFVGVEVSVQLTDRSIVQPDLVVSSRTAVVRTTDGFLSIPAAQILLLIEVAATSLAYDRGRKAALYAREGVPEYWVIDANQRTAWVHRNPGLSGYATVTEVPQHERLEAAAPELAGFGVRLEEL